MISIGVGVIVNALCDASRQSHEHLLEEERMTRLRVLYNRHKSKQQENHNDH